MNALVIGLSLILGNQSLVCSSNSDPAAGYILSAKGREITVAAKGSQNEEYFVTAAKKAADKLIVVLQNDAEGPLVKNVLVFSIPRLQKLGKQEISSIKGTDFYYEGFDGTESKNQLTCTLKSTIQKKTK